MKDSVQMAAEMRRSADEIEKQYLEDENPYWLEVARGNREIANELDAQACAIGALRAELANLYGNRVDEGSLVLDWVNVAELGDALDAGTETGAWLNSQGDLVMESVEHLGKPALFVGGWEKYLDRQECLELVRALLFWRRNERLPARSQDA